MACNCDNSGTEVGEINTQTCENSVPCAPTVSKVTQSCTCGCNPCQCCAPQTPTPLPFYNQAKSVQESHTQVLVQQTFTTAVSTGKSFGMPACGSSITISLPGVVTLQVGSYLWNVTYGYLQVTGFNFNNQTATVKNNCQNGNASPGTLIPSCTMFNVVDPPGEEENNCDEAPFVSVDFVAPAVGASVVIQVTSLIGLLINTTIQVGTADYLLTAIVSPNSIQIKNTGAGYVPGTTVPAKNTLGYCVTPITPFIPDPCGKPPETQGSLVICHNGNTSTLDAAALHQVPVCIDAKTNEVEFQSLAIPTVICTTLTACLNLISGTLTYTLVVADGTHFAVGDILVIEDVTVIDAVTGEFLRWEVTAATGTTIDVTVVGGVQPYNYSVPIDTQICHVECCEQAQYEIHHLGEVLCGQDLSKAFTHLVAFSHDVGESGTIVMPPLGVPFTAATKSVTITNNTCNNMSVMVTLDYCWSGIFKNTAEQDWHKMIFEPSYGYAQAPVPAVPVPTLNFIRILRKDYDIGIGDNGTCKAFNSDFSESFSFSDVITVAPGNTLVIEAGSVVIYQKLTLGTGACCECNTIDLHLPEVDLSNVTTWITALGVAFNV